MHRIAVRARCEQDLYLLNRETLERKTVTDFGGVVEATISGDWITFTRLGGNVEIYAYNVTTEELTNISNHPSDQFNSRNDGPHVVWTDLRSDPGADYEDYTTYGAADIWFYDVETEEARQITSGNGIQVNPDIHGDWIVWHDWRECPDPEYVYQLCMHIWGYNLVTEEERKISSIVAEDARVWGDRVYFEARYSEEPTMAGVFVQDLTLLPEPDAGPDGGK
jgi:beta propeller repeat protein